MTTDYNKLMMPVPSNLNAGRARLVDSDLYNICNRIKEIDPNLRLIYHENHEKPWVVFEMCRDGVERLVTRFEHLGPHILDHLRYMLKVPYDKRLAELERQNDAENKKYDGISDEKMDRFLWDFDKAARESNLYDPMWIRSYQKIKPKQKLYKSEE